MNRYAASALKFFAYSVAGLVILLAVGVGLLRLMLPELPAYREEIRARAGAAIGLDVEFAGIDARWRLNGPELIFTDVTLTDPDSGEAVLAAEEVSVGGSIPRMLRERRVTVGRLALTGTAVTVERLPDGGFAVQGRSAETSEDVSGGDLPRDIRVVLEDVDFTYRDPRARGGPLEARLTSLEWSRSGGDQELEARLEPGSELGSALRVLATRQEGRDGAPTWDVNVEATGLDLGRVASILPEDWPAPAAGMADVEIWSRFGAGGLRRAGAALELEGLQPAAGAPDVAPYDLSARLEWALNDGGWLAAVNDLRIERGDTLRPDSFLQVSAETDDDAALTGLEIQSGFLAMDDIRPFAAWLPAALATSFADYDPSGELLSLRLSLDGLPEGVPFTYSLEAELRDAGVAPHEGLPGVRGVSGSVRADESNGRLMLDTGALVVAAPEFFAGPIAFTRADATVVWRGTGSGLTVLCDRFILEDEWLATESSFELELPGGPEASSPRLDFSAEWRLTDLSRAPRYVPVRVMPPLVVEWLEKALVAGRAERGSLRFEGALADFPFDDGQGVFRARTSLRDATMRFALKWPDIEQLNGEVTLDGMRLASTENSAVTMGAEIEDAYTAIEDLRKGILEVRGSATGTLKNVVDYAEASPISGLFGGRLADVTASGPARVDLDLVVPVTRIPEYTVEAAVSTAGGRLSLAGFPHPLTAVDGTARISRSGVEGQDIEAMFLGSPVRIELTSAAEGESDIAALALAESRISAEALVEEAGLPLAGDIAGETAYQATVRFPRAGLADGPPVTIRVESELEGMSVTLPEPAAKPAEEAWPFSFEVAFPEAGLMAVTGFYGQTAKWTAEVGREAEGWRLARGNVHLGPGLPSLPTGSGLYLTGGLERLRLGDWLDRATAGDAAPGGLIRAADLDIGDLYAFGQRVRNVGLQLERNPSDWLVQVDGPTAAGSIIVPAQPDSGRPLVLDMQRLHLLEADPEAGDPGSPARFPPLDVRIADFRLGKRAFGAVEATFGKTETGIESEDLTASAETFEFAGSARWRVDLTDPTGQRARLAGELESTDVKATLNKLGYFPGINAEEGTVTLDLSISGPPRSEFLDELDGEVTISIRNGQLDEVEPGAGRVFGLLSVAALPRRLALDFRDVFNRGLGFDKIEGTFRIVNGDAYTCNLSLEGSVADIGVVGRAGLAKRDYNQTALVSADVGSSLPAVGAVVGGPPAAAALLLFSQIFKKPLEELGQAYYQVSGDFDDPTIERTDARRFAATSELAGCLNQGE
jgi:uncharacterized protein (TIGR02099 family)